MTEYARDLSKHLPTPEQTQEQFGDAVRFIQEIEDKRKQLINGTIPLPKII